MDSIIQQIKAGMLKKIRPRPHAAAQASPSPPAPEQFPHPPRNSKPEHCAHPRLWRGRQLSAGVCLGPSQALAVLRPRLLLQFGEGGCLVVPVGCQAGGCFGMAFAGRTS
eukprot:1474175-Rhodomonas_salina.4